MIKLKKIISHLEETAYKTLEESLLKTKAENFLYLLQSYRHTELKDPEIAKHLGINSNSLYVLKSRLNDKIQENLSGDLFTDKEEVLKQLHQIPELLYGASHEVAESFLLKLEKDLLVYDMHNELLVIYSALKKINLYSDKYFHYSQLYNRHAAFNLSLEKSEELLGNFNRVLGQYHFSRSTKLLETLIFIKKGVCDHFSLNPSRQIEIIKNLIDLQTAILIEGEADQHFNPEETLLQTHKLITELPVSSLYKMWIHPLNFLFFQHYFKTGQIGAARTYFERTNKELRTILLYTNACQTSRFLISKLSFNGEKNIETENSDLDKVLFCEDDQHTIVLMGIYNAMLAYYKHNYKKAAVILNEVLNSTSFKDFFHINLEVRLTLAYMYLKMKDFDLADNILKNLSRKIKTEEMENYSHVLNLIKVFSIEIKREEGKKGSKQKDDFMLFSGRNVMRYELLGHLMPELKKQYS